MRCPRADSSPHPGSFGHHRTGTTTGLGGAFPGLGLGAGNARGEREVSVPGWRGLTGSDVPPRPICGRPPACKVRRRVRVEAIAIICPVCCRGRT